MIKNTETPIQNLIRITLSKKGCIVHRANVGKFFTPEGRRISIGISGHSDLYGHRPDGKAFYIETKTAVGSLRLNQKAFLEAMKNSGAIAGVARSSQDATKLVFPEEDNCE